VIESAPEPASDIISEIEASNFQKSQQRPKISPHDLDIEVLGTKFTITAGEEPAYLKKVLDQYKNAIANTQGIIEVKDPLKVAILTGFLLCDEFNKITQQMSEDRMNEERELDRITRNLISCIDEVLEKAEFYED